MAKSKDSDEPGEELKERIRLASLQPDEIIRLPDLNTIIERDRRYLENLLGRVDDKVEDEYERLKMRAQIVKAYVEGTHAVLDHVHKEYEEELRFREDWGPLKWMLSDSTIAQVLARTKFAEVYGLLWKTTVPFKQTSKLMERYGIDLIKEENSKGVKVERYAVLVIVNHSRMNRELGLSAKSNTGQKYIKEFCRAGILREVGKRGRHGQKIYSIGTWVPFDIDSFRRKPFLKDTPSVREALREFRVR